MNAFPHEAGRRAIAVRPLAACLLAALAAAPDRGISAPSSARPRATLPVTSCADDGGAGTLRSVVAGAVDGDTVDLSQLECGTITLENGQIDVAVNDLTLVGPGRDALAIDAGHASRIFFHSGAGALSVNALMLANGRADADVASDPPALGMRGGCVFSHGGGTIVMTDAAVTGCEALNASGVGYAPAGGGLYARNDVTLTRTIVANNTANGVGAAGAALAAAGGGVFAFGAITLTDGTVSDNRAVTGGAMPSSQYVAVGGGLYTFLGGITITGSVVDDNFAGCDTGVGACYAAFGGGLAVTGYSRALTISSSEVARNTASASGRVFGGGVALLANAFHRIADTWIADNQALSADGRARGGGVYFDGGFPIITGSTISGNVADVGGGAFVFYARLSMSDSTVSGNSAANAGGLYNAHESGYYGGNAPLALRNTTITANVATASTAVGGVSGGIVDTQTIYGNSELQSTIVAGNFAPNADPAKADLIAFSAAIAGANDLIVAASGVALPADTIVADPLLGPLQDNGGATPTHALLFGSPALDAGNNSAALDFDQRGSGYARVVGIAADIGAFENQQAFVAPRVAKAFAPNTIGRNAVSTLTITLTNSADTAGTLTADLVDALPAPVVVAAPADAATTCPGGMVAAESGAGVVALGAGATLPAGGSCTITVSVTTGTAGAYTNTIPAGALRTDLGNSMDAAIANLTVVNTPPAASDDAYVTAENAALSVAAPGVLGDDSDADGDPLTAVLAIAPLHGALSLAADGSFVYTPSPGFVGTDGFTYLASDGQASGAARVTITVMSVDAIFTDGFDGA
ncbi:MAG TPA: Ig-like domain-containing protein [Dokdonella sp.]